MSILSASAPVSSKPCEHGFVNNVRHWSMVAIIFVHCAMASVAFRSKMPAVLYFAIEIAKFGTCAFFIISGFLLGERIDRQERLVYLERRLRRVALPWLLWFSLYCLLIVVGHIVVRGEDLPNLNGFTSLLLNTLFRSAYWFVPNMVIALCVLLIFKKQIGNWWFGVAVFVVPIVYAVNVYTLWFNSSHTTAFPAYIAYLWLGAWVSRNWRRVSHLIDSIPMGSLVVSGAILCCASMLETTALLARQSADSLNSLRITNQLYSIVFVTILLKMPSMTWPGFINVREHTFGLYLVHAPIISVILAPMKWLPYRDSEFFQSGTGLCLQVLILFSATYSCAVALTTLMAKTSFLRWAIGASGSITDGYPRRDVRTSVIVTPEVSA